MRCRMVVLSLAVIFASAGLANPQNTGNLIVNGSFEQASINPPSYVDVPAKSTAIHGWTILGHIDYIGGLWPASHGKRSLDLEGSTCNTRTTTGCLGGVAQTFATVPGEKYDVSFDLAGNPFNGPQIKTVKISAAGQSQEFSFDIRGHGGASMGWKTEHWSFTAKSTRTTLEFVTADKAPNLSGWGPALDNVVVTRAAAR